MSNPTVGSSGQWLNPAAFAMPANFALGNAPRNVGYGPNQSVVNLSEGGAVKGKTSRQRQGGNLPFVLSGPADGRVEGFGVKSAHGGSYGARLAP